MIHPSHCQKSQKLPFPLFSLMPTVHSPLSPRSQPGVWAGPWQPPGMSSDAEISAGEQAAHTHNGPTCFSSSLAELTALSERKGCSAVICPLTRAACLPSWLEERLHLCLVETMTMVPARLGLQKEQLWPGSWEPPSRTPPPCGSRSQKTTRTNKMPSLLGALDFRRSPTGSHSLQKARALPLPVMHLLQVGCEGQR